MRTKTLLIASAALAAGILAASAQTYSQNIVGYINQTLQPGTYQLINAALQADTANDAEALLPSLQNGDSVYLWNIGNQSYDAYQFIDYGVWVWPDSSVNGPPNIPVGTGFFYFNGQGGAETNTFTGTVVLSQNVTLNAGLYKLVGSAAPISSDFENANLNLPLQNGDSIYLWNTGAQSYDAYQFIDFGVWVWPDSSVNGPPTNNVAQGFFYFNGQGGDETWSQNVTVP